VKDGKPLFLFGAVRHENVLRTYFIGAESYFRPSAEIMKASRRFIRTFALYRPQRAIEAFSKSAHPLAAKWFRALGFKLVGQVDGVNQFVYDINYPKHPSKTA
jgi:hypothetical protein